MNATFEPVTVVHSLPGRLRVRVPAIKDDAGIAGAFRDFLLAQAGIAAVRLNRWCASAVISYDPAVIAPPALSQSAEHALVSAQEAPDTPAAARWPKLRFPAGLQALLGAASFAAGLLGAPAAFTYGLLAAGGAASVGRAARTLLRERRVGIDALDATAGSLMLVRGNLIAAGFMSALIGLGEYIRERTARKSGAMLVDLLGMGGVSAWVVRDGRKLRIPGDQVQVGEVVVVYPGDRVPVDGQVISGRATVDQRSLTGEAEPIAKSRGDQVFASTVSVEGKLYVQAQAVGEQTRAGQVIEIVRTAPLGETRIQNYAAKLADHLVLPIFGAALWFGLTRHVARAISLLIIDFGTGVRIAAPTTMLAAMTHAARRGILIKSGASLERLASVDAIVFDKTGTLTRGEPEVTEVISLNPSYRPNEVLGLAAAAELRLRHPAALAIVRRARRDGCVIPERTESEYALALGVRAKVDGHNLLVGNRLLLDQAGIFLGSADKQVERVAVRAESIVYVALDGQLLGLLAYADPLRPESVAVIADLRRRGIKEILMLTGDNEAVALATATQVGIKRYRAEVFPEQKAEIVRELQRAGHTVAVVGDGINDSPALVLADVAISLHHGADVAREAADVILSDDDLRRLPEALEIATTAMHLMRENLALVAVPNGVGMALAVFGRIGPAGAALANNGSTVVAALNSLRPLLGGTAAGGQFELLPVPSEPKANQQDDELPEEEPDQLALGGN